MIKITKIFNYFIIFIMVLTILICVFFIPVYSNGESSENKDPEFLDFNPDGFVWPIPGYTRISSKFGKRNAPTSGASSSHSGIDIPAPVGTKFIAVADRRNYF